MASYSGLTGDGGIDEGLAIALKRSTLSYREEQDWEEIKEHVLDESAKEDSNELRFVVIGETGSGKSETSNSILHQRGLYKSSMSAASVTKTCMIEKAEVKDRVISVVDTPGFFDADMDQQDLIHEITKCIVMTAPGPHAFLLVIRIGRMSHQVQETVRLFREIFGESCTDYLVVVFTGRDSLSEVREASTIEEYIDTIEKDVADILRDCSNRYVVFENKGEPDSLENEEQVDGLLAVVDEMVQQNGGRHYTNDMLEEAGRRIDEKERDLRREFEAEKQREMQTLRDEYDEELRELQREADQALFDVVTDMRDKDLKKTEQKFKKKDPRHEARKSKTVWEKFIAAVPDMLDIGYTVFQIVRSVQTGSFHNLPKHINNLMNYLPRKKMKGHKK